MYVILHKGQQISASGGNDPMTSNPNPIYALLQAIVEPYREFLDKPLHAIPMEVGLDIFMAGAEAFANLDPQCQEIFLLDHLKGKNSPSYCYLSVITLLG